MEDIKFDGQIHVTREQYEKLVHDLLHPDMEKAKKRTEFLEKIMNEPETFQMPCDLCKYWEPYQGVCFNGDSEYCADFVDDGCDLWEPRPDQGEYYASK